MKGVFFKVQKVFASSTSKQKYGAKENETKFNILFFCIKHQRADKGEALHKF